MAEVPKIKLVKWHYPFNRKNTLMTLCWSNIYRLLKKSNYVTTKIKLKLFSTGVKEKKQADEGLFCF